MKFLILPKKIFLTVFLALIALFLATGYFLILKKDKILEALSVQNFSLQNLSSASVSQFGIQVAKAEKLDVYKKALEDVFKKVQAKDDTWATIGDNEYLKIIFAEPLTKENDITIFAKIDGQDQEASGHKAEVYIEDGTKVAEFSEIKHGRSYKVLLTNLKTPQDTFYLKAVGNIAFDYVVDPTEAGISFNAGLSVSAGIEAPAGEWVCGDTLIDTRDSKTYDTVLIGNQCWMAQNINVGTKIPAATRPQGTSCASASDIHKYCQEDNDANCTIYGGLYDLAQTICGATGCNGTGAAPNDDCASPIQGICPAGWHIPSHYEFTTLERAVCTSDTCATDFPYDESTGGFFGTNEGAELKSGGSSGFNALLAGYSASGHTLSLGERCYFWSSSQTNGAWDRYLDSRYTTVGRYDSAMFYGFSIRCIKDAD